MCRLDLSTTVGGRAAQMASQWHRRHFAIRKLRGKWATGMKSHPYCLCNIQESKALFDIECMRVCTYTCLLCGAYGVNHIF